MPNKSGASPQAVSIPIGGGDTRGLGESFQPDLNSGVGNYRVPLDLLPGVRNFQPTLALIYSTGAGNSPWGLGWNLPVPAISRRKFRGVPTYDDTKDVFLYAGASELVEVEPQTYRATIENSFERIFRTASGWEVIEKSGIHHFFGSSSESRIEQEEDGQTRVFAWLLERTEDTTGNAITYHYRKEGAQRYLREVRYAIYTICFEYEPRPDSFSEFTTGFEIRTTLRCSSISLQVQPLGANSVRTWNLEYDESPLSGLSMLTKVTFTGFDPETNTSTSLPSLEFFYTGFAPEQRRYQKFSSEVGALPPGLENPNAELIDLDGYGLPGVLMVENGMPRYWPNIGHLCWGAPRTLLQFPAVFSIGDDRVQFADMDGNGAADLLIGSSPFSGYYENNGQGQFEHFVHYMRSPNFTFEDNVRLLDVNGDGLIDAVHSGRTGLQVYENLGPAGWEPPHVVPKSDSEETPPDLSRTDPRIHLADMNGDGLLDVVMIVSGHIEYWPSRGNGRYASKRVMKSSPLFPYPFDLTRVFLTDIDGDGLADVLYVDYDKIIYWINQSGNSFSQPQTILYTPPTSNPETLRIADMNGTGAKGLLWTSPYSDYRYLDFTGGVKPGLLQQIESHLGRVTTVKYSTSTEQALIDRQNDRRWSSFLPFPVQVVASVTVKDSTSGTQTITQYRYHEGHYDGHEREFNGFAVAEQIEVGDPSIPSTITVFYYHTEASTRSSIPDPESRRALKRKLYQVEVYGRDGSPIEHRPYRVEQSRWTVRVEHSSPDHPKILFPNVAETITSTFERGANARIEKRSFTFDKYGNVLSEERWGEGNPASRLYLKTEVEYAYNEANWVVDRPARIIQRNEAGDLLSETRHYYDGPAFQGLHLGHVKKGLLSRTERVALLKSEAANLYGLNASDFIGLSYRSGQNVDGQPTWNLDHERRKMDHMGNVIAKLDGRGNKTSYEFDAFGLFTIKVTDAKGFEGKVEHDYRVGKPRRMINPNGGATEARYDPLGRITKVAFSGDTLDMPTVSHTYNTTVLPAVRVTEYRVHSGQPQTLQIFEYLDGNGSVFQRLTEHDGNTFVVSGHIVTNSRGKMSEKFRPFFANGTTFQQPVNDPAAPRQKFFYDALGRPTETINSDGGKSRAVYEAWQTSFYDPGDNDPTTPTSFNTPRVEQYDAWQRLVAVQERDTNATLTTEYLLDPLGRLCQVTDAQDNTLTQLTYDLLGRRIAIRHADAGQRLIVYDAAGNIAIVVDAAGQIIRRTFDELNRTLETVYKGVAEEKYFYDNGPGANLVGRLERIVDPSGETIFSYDGRGNVVERTKNVPGNNIPFTFRYAYDRLGRLTQLTYPDGVPVAFEYYTGMLLRRIPNYVNAIEYATTGIRSAIEYANGVRTEYQYDNTTSRLHEIKSWQPSRNEIYYHTRFTINKAGNIETILDLRANVNGLNRNQSFGYDAFNRLNHSEGANDSGNYTQDYEFDANGNFLKNPLTSQHPLVYMEVGKPNRLTGYNDGVNNVKLFDYDANGNMTTMPGRTLIFDPKHQLERVKLNDGTDIRFFYDYKGVLARREVTRQNVSRTTLYFDNLYEIQGTTATRWIFAGELPVAHESNGTKVFLHNDQLGSTVVYTDENGNRSTETAYYPFGCLAVPPAANALPSFTAKRFFVDIGLYYFNTRWYSPHLGRFISPDPLYLFQPEQGIQDPKRLNPYSYAGNNPLRYVDPSGLGFWDVLGKIIAVVAIIVAVAAVAVLTCGVGVGLGALALYAGAAGLAGAAIGAIVGGIAYGSWEGALRGTLIGFTAGVNTLIGSFIFGPIVGAALGITTFLSIIPSIAKSDVYQGILGWNSYIMPMSWPGHAIGLFLFTLNVLGFLFTFGQVDSLRIRDVKVDWKTGNIFTVGGWTGEIMPRAFNLGAFTFVNPSRYVDGEIAAATFEHESGHMLSNAAFGFIQVFRIFEGNSTDSYWERIAESNVPPGLRGMDPTEPEPDRPRISQWG